MRNCFTIFATLLIFLSFATKNAQAQQLSLQSGPVAPAEMFEPSQSRKAAFSSYLLEGKYFLVLQFREIPSTTEQASLRSEGIHLLSYLPEKCFLAAISSEVNWDNLSQKGVSHALALQPHHKLSRELADHTYPAHALVGQQIRLRLLSYPGISQKTFARQLQQAGYQAEQDSDLPSAMSLTIPLFAIDKLASLSAIMYVEAGAAPAIPDGLRGRTSHRANWLSEKPGTGYDGTGIIMAIADDGGVDHPDLKGRFTDYNSSLGGSHGDMTSGIAVGAGNIDPTGVGMATGAYLHMYSINGYPQINDALPNFYNLGTVITSTSYSQGCGGRYESSAQALDQGVDSIPSLLHVFSAGNSASSSCSSVYGSFADANGYSYGNITGGRKAAKHSIATANMKYNDERDLSSSRGPCEDGRLKPDISAHGNSQISTYPNTTYAPGGGTSAAAPGIAGVSCMLYQAYNDLYGGQHPASSLIKSILLNSADDLGRPGPDYDFGWGRVNARRALEVLEQNQFSTHSISNQDTNTHSLMIPSGVKEVKVMLYWHDPAGSPMASKALVNDLDLRLSQGTNSWRPWRLSTYPHIDSIQHNAWRGIDHVNNMEQVALNNPAAGSYTIEVLGENVPFGPQSYHITYVFIYDEIVLTYPRGGESFVPGVSETIRWDAFGTNGSFLLQYSLNNGQNWLTISANVAGSRRYYDWEVDSTVTGQALVRVSRGGLSDQSDATFDIIQAPANLRMLGTSPTEGQLQWDAVPGANIYDVFILGAKYMDSVGSTSHTFYPFSNLVKGPNFWCSVRARDTLGNIIGRRAVAKEYDHNPSSVCSSCAIPIDTFPYFQSFENGLEDWCQFYGEELDWTIQRDSTSSVNTGPQSATDGTYYLYVEASFPNYPSKTAILGSPCFDLSNFAKGYLTFSYHMYGAAMGSLFLEVSVDSGQSWSTGVWTRSGNQGPSWHRDSIDLTSYLGEVVAFRFRAVTGSDFRSDIAIDHIEIKEDPRCTHFNVMASSSDISCKGYENGMIDLQSSGGAGSYLYTWFPGGMGPSQRGLGAGFYQCQVEDANGCILIRKFWIREPDSLQVNFQTTPISCHGGNNGSAQAIVQGGNGGNSFVWSNNTFSDSTFGLGARAYTVLVTDRKGCSVQAGISLSEPPPFTLSLTATNPLCHGTASGSLNPTIQGAQGALSYAWSNGANSMMLSNIAAGNYSLTITDGMGCIANASKSLQDPPALSLQFQVISPSCFGYADGSATGTAFGGAGNYQYHWANGPATPTRNMLPAGNFALRITDANGCVFTDSVRVLQPGLLTVSAAGLDLACFGDSSGRAVASAGGGTAPYSYLWSHGATSSVLDNLPVGNYAVIVTDAHGCQANKIVNIRQPAALRLTLTATDESAPGAKDGTASVLVSGGTPPYVSYTWSNGSNGSMLNGLAPGVYGISVVDSRGCSITDSVVVGGLNGLGEKISVSLFKLYPNPASDRIWIEYKLDHVEESRLSLWDTQGKLLYQELRTASGKKQKVSLDISGLASGMYFIQVESEHQKAATRFISK